MPSSVSASPDPNVLSYNPSPSISSKDDHRSRPSFDIATVLPSPALPPLSPHLLDAQSRRSIISSIANSTTTSPVIHSQQSRSPSIASALRNVDVDMDHEATAALLMLNLDWRLSANPLGIRGGGAKKMGISVQDLLSS